MTSLYDFPLTPLPSRSLLKVTEPPVRRCGEGSRSGVRFLLNLATVLLLIPPAASAQNTTYARLVGTVTDQTGAVLPGVEVTVETRSTNVAQTTLTDERGDYIVDRLLAGRYDLRADLPGFKSYVALDIRLEVNQVARADVKMSPGEIADQVTVPARSTIIDTDSVEVGTVVEEQKILDLPLRGRDLLKLVYLTTGGTQEQQEIGWVRFGGGYPTFNGLYSHSNLNLLDGVRNQNFFFQAPAVTPTPETIQEFKVITNNYSAEHGQVGGAVISMLSKSGNNELHGHAWYYFRDERDCCITQCFLRSRESLETPSQAARYSSFVRRTTFVRSYSFVSWPVPLSPPSGRERFSGWHETFARINRSKRRSLSTRSSRDWDP